MFVNFVGTLQKWFSIKNFCNLQTRKETHPPCSWSVVHLVPNRIAILPTPYCTLPPPPTRPAEIVWLRRSRLEKKGWFSERTSPPHDVIPLAHCAPPPTRFWTKWGDNMGGMINGVWRTFPLAYRSLKLSGKGKKKPVLFLGMCLQESNTNL